MQNEGDALLVQLLLFSATVWQAKLLKSREQVENVSNVEHVLLTMPSFQNLVHDEIVDQNHRNTENTKIIYLKFDNQHLESTHTKY